jgi:cytochrome bd-type quinol oxidase subunit 2
MRITTALFVAFLLLYAYFYQGGGWNQNSRFDLTRAIVEQQSFEIGRYAANTGDLALHSGRVYSNKPPGQSVLGAPAYAAALGVTRLLGLNPSSPEVQGAHAHWITIATSAAPGALVVALLFIQFRRRRADPRAAFLLSVAFGVGSLVFPYAGVLMAHNLAALALFAGWLGLSASQPSKTQLALAGAALGFGLISDYVLIPLLALYGALYLSRRTQLGRGAWTFWLGPIIALATLALYNALCFGHVFSTSYASDNPAFRDSALLLGVFDWPDPRRLYWLSLHPFRGLLFCCPLFLLPLVSLSMSLLSRVSVKAKSKGKSGQAQELAGLPLLDALFCLAVVLYFLAFNLSFNGWTGGWGVGPRYLIPMLPFLYVFAAPGYQHSPRLSYALMTASAVLMLAVTSVLVISPGPNSGPPPPGRNPVFEATRALAQGRVSIGRLSIAERSPGPARASDVLDRWDSYNIGEVLGLHGGASLLPLLAFPAWLIYCYRKLPEESEAAR